MNICLIGGMFNFLVGGRLMKVVCQNISTVGLLELWDGFRARPCGLHEILFVSAFFCEIENEQTRKIVPSFVD